MLLSGENAQNKRKREEMRYVTKMLNKTSLVVTHTYTHTF